MSEMKTTSLAAFASQLRAWRQQMGWTQVEAADKLGIVIQVLPFTADHAGTDGPISIYEFAEAPSVAYTECYSGGRIVEAHAEVADLMTVMSMLRASASPPRESRELIRRIRSEIDDQS